jgi:integrase/recombinase XerD
MKINEFLKTYIEHKRGLGRAKTTLQHDLHELTEFFASSGVDEIQQVQHAHIRSHWSELSSRDDLSPASRVAKMRAVLTAFHWATERKLLLFDPSQGMRLRKEPRTLMPILTEAEMDRLLSAPSQLTPTGRRDRALLELLYGTGARPGEALRVQLNDLDLANQNLLIRKTKNGNQRLLPVGDQLGQVLERYLRESRPFLALSATCPNLFLNQRGRPLSQDRLFHLLAGYAKAVGLACTPYSLRRAFATHLLEYGANLVELKALLGHADLSTTQIYAQVLPSTLIKDHRQSHPRARGSQRA